MSKNNVVGKIPYDKSNNIETSLLSSKGRISRQDFWLRAFVCVFLCVVFYLVFIYCETPDYYKWVVRGGGKIQSGAVQIELRHYIMRNISYYILPAIFMVFIIIQAIKRAHDCNKSSAYLLIPIYNIYLMLAEGTPNDNDYGLLPYAGIKNPSYTFGQKDDNLQL